MGIKVTIYNDDPNGRAIQVMKINSRAGGVFERKVLQSSDDGRGEGPYCVDITQDEMLITTAAEAVGDEPKPEPAAPSEPIDTTNDCAVCVSAQGVGMLNPPLGPMPKAKALRLAAYIVALAEEKEGEFEAVLTAVKNT